MGDRICGGGLRDVARMLGNCGGARVVSAFAGCNTFGSLAMEVCGRSDFPGLNYDISDGG
jgi:hypothetical protein